MASSKLRSPFRPGAGRLPPYFAGREREQEVLRQFVEPLRAGHPAPSDLVLYGPRGNGKTALLGWLQNEVAAANSGGGRGQELESLWFTPDEVSPVAGLVSRIGPRSWLEELGITRLSVPGAVEVGLRRDEEFRGRLLSEALAARVRRNPLILLLDEAHGLDPSAGRALLNAVQRVGRRAPLLLVLAGTPNLRSRLRTMDASFWPRARHLPIGRLPETAAGDAVRIPLRRAGVGIAVDPLRDVVTASQRYPFFLQLWGDELWRAANSGGGSLGAIGVEVVREAARGVTERTDLYYLERYEELEERNLLPVAWALADAFGAGRAQRNVVARLGATEVREAVRRGLGEGTPAAIRKATETLFHLGVIWRSGGVPDWEPGIPSLLDYLWRYTPDEDRPPLRSDR